MRRLIEEIEEEDPLSFIANLFDVAVVLALAFMVMLLISYNMADLIQKLRSRWLKIRERITCR